MSSSTLPWAALAAVCAGAAVVLGWHHPITPAVCLSGIGLVVLATARWPHLWLVLVPAGLPWLNFSPWTGWLLVEEFDLLLLAVFAGGFCRLAIEAARTPVPAVSGPAVPMPAQRDTALYWLVVVLAMSGVVGVVRGLAAAESLTFGWWQGYGDPLNTLRVAKSLLFGLLTLPLLRRTLQIGVPKSSTLLLVGMLLGLTCVATAALWERLAYPGLLDFSTVYRVTALFWEMHVGGGAVDAYLALASPFAILALMKSRNLRTRLGAALLLVVVAYVCLMTFSRGVYLSVAIPALFMVVAGLVLRRVAASRTATRELADRRWFGRLVSRLHWWLLVMIGVLVWQAAGPDSFLANRLANTDKVWAARQTHWDNSIGLLKSPAQWWWGIGWGRFPATYSRGIPVPGAAGSVAHHVGDLSTLPYVTVRGPPNDARKAGLFALTQRIDLQPGRAYIASGYVRSNARPTLVVQVCERHLLYDWQCQSGVVRVQPSFPGWRHVTVPLEGRPFAAQPWYAQRLGMLSLSVVSVAGQVDISDFGVTTHQGRQVLVNGDFARGLARWFPAAQYYFVPWHTDSMFLELLVERGLVGLLPTVALLVFAAVRSRRLMGQDAWLALCLLASVAGALIVGFASSYLDVPRVAFLMYLLCFFAVLAGARSGPGSADSLARGARPSYAL